MTRIYSYDGAYYTLCYRENDERINKARIFVKLLKRYVESIDNDINISIWNITTDSDLSKLEVYLHSTLDIEKLSEYLKDYEKLYEQIQISHTKDFQGNSTKVCIQINDIIDEDVEFLYALEKLLGLKL